MFKKRIDLMKLVNTKPWLPAGKAVDIIQLFNEMIACINFLHTQSARDIYI